MDLFCIGRNRTIESSDIYRNCTSDQSKTLTDEFERRWNEEMNKKQPKLFNVIRQIYAPKIIGISVFYTIVDAIARYDQKIHLE